MARGAPDYSNVRKEEFTFRVDDLAELSARLSKSVSPERGGEVVYFEDWQYGGVNWLLIESGAGTNFDLQTDNYVSEGVSAKLVGGSDEGQYIVILNDIPYLSLISFGLECRFLYAGGIDKLELGLDIYTGSLKYFPRWRLDFTNELLELYDKTSGWVTVKNNVKPSPENYCFNFMKFTADLTYGNYQRGLMNNQLALIDGYYVDYLSNTENPRTVIRVKVHSKSGFNGFAYVDNIILTRNEV